MIATSAKERIMTFLRSRLARQLAWGLLGFVGACFISLVVLYSIYSRDADSFLTLFALRQEKTISKVYDRNGDVIGIFAEERRVIIPYGDIPKAFVNGLVATEDADFWSHGGFSPRGVLRSGYTFIISAGRRKEGASTLTMQLIRNVTNKRERRILGGLVKRKMLELILARKLEKAYTKKQIFQQYANEVYFGGGRYGIEAAAGFYFGKTAPQLNVEECATLAGILQNANYLYPYSRDPKTRQLVINRRNHVLDRMVSEDYLKEADAKLLKLKPLRLARENPQEESLAPYAVEEVRKLLYDKYGKDAVLNGGLEVYTTLDSLWQEAANDSIRAGLKAVDRRRGFRKEGVQFVKDPETTELPAWKRFLEEGDSVPGVILGWKGSDASVRVGKATLTVPQSAFAWAGKEVQKLLPRGAAPLFLVKETDEEGLPLKLELDQDPDLEGALLAVDPATGEIRAMVGGYDFKRSKLNRSTPALRQVGSTTKAFVYGASFVDGMTPATMVDDAPIRYNSLVPHYEPKNYERDFFGPIPIWEALRDSRNVAAVRTLEKVGAERVAQFAHNVGLEGHILPVPSMALGSMDLRLSEMVRGYSTFALGGRLSPQPFLIRKVVDRSGKVMESHSGAPGDQVVDPVSTYQLIQCLMGVAQQGTGSRTNELNWPVAGKTGTTDEYTDAWFLGFSTRICCGVWVGLDAKKTLYRGADGGKVAVPIWVNFMKTALPTTPKEPFTAPDGMDWADIDKYTGLIATSATDPKDILHLAFKPGTLPKAPSTSDVIQRIRDARAKAHSQAVEERAWGFIPTPPAEPGAGEWTGAPDPNK